MLLQSQMARTNVDLVAIAPTANMRYLIGFAPLADERPCYLLVSQDAVELVIPELNADQVETHTGRTVRRWPDASGADQAVLSAVAAMGLESIGVLAADSSMRADALLRLQTLVQPATSVAAADLMALLRRRKSEAELDLLARAAAVTDAALLVGAEACRPGVTERQVAAEIANFYRANGAETVDFVIVASGPNGAFPHHETSDRRMQVGDTIILDIGATLTGYKSDITRVVHLGEPTAEVKAVYQAVLEANRKGRAAALAEVDLVARKAIEQAGYGAYFRHRTGHGLGLEVHEPPWITSESETVLEAGMVFSVEPGIYLPGKFGVRIEDIVVVTEAECRNLTGVAHELIVNV
jgi:Xaa-Pro aminopeptidase